MAAKMSFLTDEGLKLFWRNLRKILGPVFICNSDGDSQNKDILVYDDFNVKNYTQMIVYFSNTNTALNPVINIYSGSLPNGTAEEEAAESADPSAEAGGATSDTPGTGPIEVVPYDPTGNTGDDEGGEYAEEYVENVDPSELLFHNQPVYGINSASKVGYLTGFCHLIFVNNAWHLVSSEAATQRTIYYTEGDNTPQNYKIGDIWLKKKTINEEEEEVVVVPPAEVEAAEAETDP